MAPDGKSLAEAFKAMSAFSIPKLDYPKHCKYRSGQLKGPGGWKPDEDNPNRKFKVWHCRKLDRRVIWRDCHDNDAEQHCAEVDDAAS